MPFARVALAAAALAWPAVSAWAQAGTARTTVSPYASAQLTLTDNYELNAGTQAADAITRLTAGVAMRSTAGRVQGQLDYSLSALLYAQHGGRNTHQHQLSAIGEIEWYERQGYLTAAASIQQVARSAFDAPVRADGLPGRNTAEARSLRIAPRWQGLLPGGLQVRLLADGTLYSTQGSDSGDVRNGTLSARVSPFRPAPLTWAVDLLHQSNDYQLTRSTRSSRATGALFWTLTDLDLLLTAQAGSERSNFTTLQARQDTTWGLGVQWQPSPRTRVRAEIDERAFGQTHQVSAEYRTPRSVWQLSDSRGISTGGTGLGIGQRGRAFDILFAEFASVEPDFARRAALVDAELARAGLNANSLLTTTFLRSSVTIDDRQEASFGWRGPRLSILFNASRSVARRLDLGLVGRDDLDLSSRVRQNAISLALIHKLTPDMTASLTLTGQSGRGDLATLQSRARSVVAQLNGRLRADDSWSLTLRHSGYETGLVPYSETALAATYGIRF